MAFIVADRVQETSTTTGVGALALDGASTGFQAFSAVAAVGDTCYYAIVAVDAGGAPTGAWEVGLGTYSAADTLTRTTVIVSSNANAAVDLAAGTKNVFVTAAAQQVSWMRERLTAARTYYVRTDGADTNTGLADTAGGAFLTVQKACDTITDTLLLAGNTVTVQIADGTYTTPVVLRPLPDRGSAVIQGNSGTPENVVISTTSATPFSAAGAGSIWIVKDLKVQTTTSGYGLQAQTFGELHYSNIVFGACSIHVYANTSAIIWCDGNYSITGAANSHFSADFFGSILCYGRTLTISGTPAFVGQFATAATGSIYLAGNTYTGSATGKRYTVSMNGVLNSGGVTLPGNVAGTTATGGQYV